MAIHQFESQTSFEKRREEQLSKSDADMTCVINGKVFPHKIVKMVSCVASTPMPFAILGTMGVGKTYFAKNGLPSILKEVNGRTYRVVVSQPFQLKSPSDIYCRPSLKSGDLVWDYTPLIKAIQEAIAASEAVLLVIEEFTRMSAQAMNFLLEPLNDHCISIEQTGEQIELPPGSRVALLGNPSGVGTTTRHEALHDRIFEITWPVPTPAVLAKMVKHTIDNDNQFKSVRTSFGVSVADRKLDWDQAEVIAKAIIDVNAIRRVPLTVRAALKCAYIYLRSDSVHNAIEHIVTHVLTQGENTSLDEIKNRLVSRIKSDLRCGLQ